MCIRDSFQTAPAVEGAVGDVHNHARSDDLGGDDLTIGREFDEAEFSAQQYHGFILGGIGMAVGLDIGVGLQGVEQPMAGVFVCGVQIMIEASPGSGGGPDGEVVQKGGAKRANTGGCHAGKR